MAGTANSDIFRKDLDIFPGSGGSHLVPHLLSTLHSTDALSPFDEFSDLADTSFFPSSRHLQSFSKFQFSAVFYLPSIYHLSTYHLLIIYFLSSIYLVIYHLSFYLSYIYLSSVQSLSRVRFFVTPWTAARQASLSITNSQSLLKLRSIESVMPSNHLILCHPLLLLPSIFPSIRVFSNESALCIRWPKYWSFSFSICPSNECSGLVGSPCSPRDAQESSPIPQFKSINFSVLSFLPFFYLSNTSCPRCSTLGKNSALYH